jgi:hypothetical protein
LLFFLKKGCFFEANTCNDKKRECFEHSGDQTLCDSENNKITTGFILIFSWMFFYFLKKGCFFEANTCNIQKRTCFEHSGDQTLCDSENNKITTGSILYLNMIILFYHKHIYNYSFHKWWFFIIIIQDVSMMEVHVI